MLLVTIAQLEHFLTKQRPLHAALVQWERFPKHMQLHVNHGEFVVRVHMYPAKELILLIAPVLLVKKEGLQVQTAKV